MSVASVTIRKLLERVSKGEIRIPAFQREFIWEPDRVQFLMDSIYKGYPIGTLLLWRTKEQLQSDRDLGPYTLPNPEEQYPIDYVLDGQQRLTSIFSVFQTILEPNPNTAIAWVDVYFDLLANEAAQDSQFVALEPPQVVPARHIPLKVLFDVPEYGKLIRQVDDATAERLYTLQNRFTEAQIPVETVETENHSRIAIIFERVNRGGVQLDTYQLLSAWTWSGDFDLRNKFDDLGAELDDFGYGDLADDPDLLLKCCASVIKNDASAHSIVELKGGEVRDRFPEFQNGLKGAIEFLKRDCEAISLKVLPYKSMIIPLVRFFATDNAAGLHPNANQRDTLIRWFWQSCFSRRYSNSVDTALKQDIEAVILLTKNDNSGFDRKVPPVSPDFFKENVFSLNAVNTRTHILLLAQQKPTSFLSDSPVDLENVLLSCNRTEFHHIFPKDYLDKVLGIKERADQFMLANFAFLSQTDNRKIKNRAPSLYKKDIPAHKLDDILKAALIPKDGLDMKYDDFIDARAKLLADKATQLCD
jgi:hypothetical protein